MYDKGRLSSEFSDSASMPTITDPTQRHLGKVGGPAAPGGYKFDNLNQGGS